MSRNIMKMIVDLSKRYGNRNQILKRFKVIKDTANAITNLGKSMQTKKRIVTISSIMSPGNNSSNKPNKVKKRLIKTS